MNCEKARQLLDAYVDGELSAVEMCALENHAKACSDCMEELEAAKLLKDTLEHMDDDIVVPLEAQAAWRKAVRAEANKKVVRRWTRGVYAVAAALVLFLGARFAFREEAPEQNMLVAADMSRTSMNMIETDGITAGAGAMDYTVRKKIVCDSIISAQKKLEALAAEYNGSMAEAGEGAYRIELPTDYMNDFLTAMGKLGEEQESEIFETADETVVVLVQLSKG